MAKKSVENYSTHTDSIKINDATLPAIHISRKSKRVYIRTSRWKTTLAIILFMIPWLGLTYFVVSDRLKAQSHSGSKAEPAKIYSGPWGTIEAYEMNISPPKEYIQLDLFPDVAEEWLFNGMSRDGLEKLLIDSNLEKDVREKLMGLATNTPGVGWKIRPDDDSIFKISPVSRAAIYSVLARCSPKNRQYDPFVLNAERFNRAIDASSLRAETRALTRKLIYAGHDSMYLADINALMRAIPDENEKLALLEILLRRRTYFLKLGVDSIAVHKALVQYWGGKERHNEVEPVLKALCQMDAIPSASLSAVLPAFAKERLYLFPPKAANSNTNAHRDCHWTSFNFFNETPDDKFADPSKVREALLNDYQPIDSKELKLGDLALFMTPELQTVHSCVYIAGDFYFGKNGPSAISPWIIVKLEDINDSFPSFENLTVHYYRLKSQSR